MPISPTYPGVYIEEVPSGVRTITGVATSITAFIGRALKGQTNDPIYIQSYADYDRRFGGMWRDSTMSYAVQHYFLNGGTDALVVRVEDGAVATEFQIPTDGVAIDVAAANPGTWGDNLQLVVDHDTSDQDEMTPVLFNLTIREVENGATRTIETFRNLSATDGHSRYVGTVLDSESNLLRVTGTPPFGRPTVNPNDGQGVPIPVAIATPGDDGSAVGFDEIADPGLETDRHGIWALEDADLFNLLCIPPFTRDTDVDGPTWAAALAYCKLNRAMLIVDPPSSWNHPDDVLDGTTGVDGSAAELPGRDENAEIFFPRVRMADPLQENRLATFAPCGIVAGIHARTDAQRGVWKAPAGQDATLSGVRQLSYKLTDGENGRLNPLGVNCLRSFPVIGPVVWGSRTAEGADRLASEWKYVPVRRLALYMEESLFRGTQWVIFEPNDEPLWAQIRLNVGAFMHGLFRQGAFQGSSPKDAYFVKCDGETTTQNDRNQGIVNVHVGFAPLKPAEFLIIKISQIAGDIQT